VKKDLLWRAALLTIGTLAPLDAQDLRVELFSKQPIEEVRLRAGGSPVRLCGSLGKQPCLVLEAGTTARCAAAAGGVRCTAGATARRLGRVSVSSPSPFRLEVGSGEAGPGELLRGVIVRAAEVVRAGKGVRGLATVELETYVAGVLAGEGATLKSLPALAAMAVVARTWALRSRGRHRARGFDFCSLTHCQFFRLPSESGSRDSPALRDAMAKTTGLVLMYHDQLIDAYYSAHCGGVTEAAGEIWPDRGAPYLRSVTDPYCARSAQSAWQQTLPLATVDGILRDKLGVSVGGHLRNLRVERKNASGRVCTLRAEGASSRQIDANEFRYAVNRQLGWNTLKSNLYRVARQGNSLLLAGRGLGHGVGLCQAGAEQMGQMRIPYERILAHYFPGTTIDQVTARVTHRVLSSEHFELVFPPGQHPWADETLRGLEAARRELRDRAALLPGRARVRTWETTEEFIRAAGQPGWVAASNDGQAIELQPLRTLKRKGILNATLRHELTHLVVHRLRAPKIPRWFEEGLVLYLTGEQVGATSPDAGRSLEEIVSRPRSEAEMKAAYACALERVRELARRRGATALWQVLQHPSAEDVLWLNRR